MLRDIYLATGGIGAFFMAITMFVSFIAWWMAVTATVTRDLSRAARAAIVVVVSLFPPLGMFVASWYVISDRRAVSEAMADMSERVEGPLRPQAGQSIQFGLSSRAA